MKLNKFFASTLMTLVISLIFFSNPINASTIPKIRNSVIKPKKLAEIMGRKKLVLWHNKQTIETDYATLKGRYVSGLAVIDTNVETVRQTFLNFEKHPTFIPNLTTADVKKDTGNTVIVDMSLSVKVPIISPTFYYTLKFNKLENGDIKFRLTKGDIKATKGRWEFFDVGKNKTLVAYTSWVDLNDLGWTIDTIFWAEPDLKKAIPISQSVVAVESFRKHLEGPDTKAKNVSEPDSSPEIPVFSRKKEKLRELVPLTTMGTPMLIHPHQTVKTKREKFKLPFVSSLGILNIPPEEAQQYVTQFNKYPQFVRQLKEVSQKKTENGFKADWYLEFSLVIMDLGVDLTLKYTWVNDHSLIYRSIKGDIKHSYGAVEMIPYQNNKTILVLSHSDYIHNNAPTLLKLLRIIPNRQLVAGSSVVGLGIEKLIPWVHKQAQNPTQARLEGSKDHLTRNQ